MNDSTVLQAVGKAAVGHVVADAYLVTVDTPENQECLKAWRAHFPNAPIGYRYPDLGAARVAYAISRAGDVMKKAGSLDTEALIRAWEGAKFTTAWGEVEMRACDHQMLTRGFVAEIMEPSKIPPAIRHWPDIPYLGPATMVPPEDITVPPRETGNPRCV